MPGSRRERNAAPAQALRLQAAAQSPAPIPLTPSPSPSAGRSRAQELGYPTDAEVQRERGGERAEAGFNPHGNSPFYLRADPQTPDAAPQRPPGEPPAWSLPPEVEASLRAPFTASVEPSEEAWAEASLRLMCELVAHAGFNALTNATAYDCRAMAYALLTGRELAS